MVGSLFISDIGNDLSLSKLYRAISGKLRRIPPATQQLSAATAGWAAVGA